MAEGNNDEGIVEEQLRDGHKIIFNLKCHQLHTRERTSHVFDRTTQCPTMPSTWRNEMTFERLPQYDGNYNFTAGIRRLDYGNNVQEATLVLELLNARGRAVIPPQSSYRDRVAYNIEWDLKLFNALPSLIKTIAAVKVTLEIHRCHMQNTWLLSSEFIADKNEIIQNSKL